MMLVQIANGLMEGMMLFLIASGLTLIFGVSRIVNFAHGSFYMLGAFLTYQLIPILTGLGDLNFFLAVLLAALMVAMIGMAFEVAILRRIYGGDELLQLIITVALVLIIRDAVRTIWGINDLTTPLPDSLSGAVEIAGQYFPMYLIVVFLVGMAVSAAMMAIIRYTRAGILLRAATDDRGMVALLGIDQARIFTGVFAVGCFLAGLAGGLAAPFGNINSLLDTTVIVTAFIVVVIGGLGNLRGALLSALAIGVLKAVGLLWFPRLSMVMIFVVMAVVLIFRSSGRAHA
ncbi:branched-chain amino acid ABC transporter permease [Microvirga sp. G4-2]|uniref:branched-chain amino acid ABC transporter permease n=1 Tax=Microvirga sp. G4-2 TaxID=3434467 RepID=UPI004044CB1E